MRVRALSDFGNIEDFENLKRFVSSFANGVLDVVNGNLEFGSNIRSSLVEDISFSGSPVTVQHGLAKTPTGYILVKSSASINIFSAGDSNSSTIVLNSSGSPATCSVLFF